ncbi:MAG: type II toxin-antitoxin system death-on-curing family toxin [bacterium]|nr:type II toxin-antitoxin system death-on-curing family toxin [bacterium]
MPKKIKYLTVVDVLLLHYLVIEETGGYHGLRSLALLESAVARPRASHNGKDLYKTIFEKAAGLCHSLIKNHPFIDGNKRTGIYAAMTLLEINGYKVTAKQKKVVEVALAIATKDISILKIAELLKKDILQVK